MAVNKQETTPAAKPHLGWVLALTSTAYFMVVLDSVVVLVALTWYFLGGHSGDQVAELLRYTGIRPSGNVVALVPAIDEDPLSGRLHEEGLTMEGAARKLDVSTKTISRWVAGSTEPRLRDLYRIRETFGEPFH